MRITILGAGAVGSVIGASLCDHHDVTLVARPDHARKIASEGLRIAGTRELVAFPAVAEELLPLMPGELLFVTVKAHALREALEPVADRIPADTLVVLLQNGLGVEEIAEHVLPGRRLVRAVVGIGATFREPGCVEHWDGPSLPQWGGPGLELPASRDGHVVAEAFGPGWIRARCREDFESVVWRKLAVNCVVNPLSSILRVRNCDAITPETAEIRRGVFEEVRAVAAAADIVIEGAFLQSLEERIKASQNWNSMLQDLERGRPTEIDFLNGAVSERGRAQEIPTPMNDTLTALVRALEGRPALGNVGPPVRT